MDTAQKGATAPAGPVIRDEAVVRLGIPTPIAATAFRPRAHVRPCVPTPWQAVAGSTSPPPTEAGFQGRDREGARAVLFRAAPSRALKREEARRSVRLRASGSQEEANRRISHGSDVPSDL